MLELSAAPLPSLWVSRHGCWMTCCATPASKLRRRHHGSRCGFLGPSWKSGYFQVLMSAATSPALGLSQSYQHNEDIAARGGDKARCKWTVVTASRVDFRRLSVGWQELARCNPFLRITSFSGGPQASLDFRSPLTGVGCIYAASPHLGLALATTPRPTTFSTQYAHATTPSPILSHPNA